MLLLLLKQGFPVELSVHHLCVYIKGDLFCPPSLSGPASVQQLILSLKQAVLMPVLSSLAAPQQFSLRQRLQHDRKWAGPLRAVAQ